MICSTCKNAGENVFCTSRIELFKDLPLELQGKIATSARHFEVPANEIIISEENKATSLFIIREGKVKINRFDIDGREYILDIRSTGETLGEEAFMQKDNFDYSVSTLTNTKLCEISKSEIIKLVEENPSFAISFIELLSKKLIQNEEKIRLLMEGDALKRIVGFLLERNSRLKGDDISLTVDDIAASTNLRRETVSRKLRELQKDSLIQRIGQKKLKIVDIKRLLEIFYES